METKQIYLLEPYIKEINAKVLKSKNEGGSNFSIIFDQTILYPFGGGQPTDQGEITQEDKTWKVIEVKIHDGEIINIISTNEPPLEGSEVLIKIDWKRRYKNMAVHSAGHIIDFALQKLGYVPNKLSPLKASHGSKPEIIYKGKIEVSDIQKIQEEVNKIISSSLDFNWKLTTLEEIEKTATYLQPGLPRNKPLRKLSLEDYGTVADGGTIVKNTSEIKNILINSIEVTGEETVIKYEAYPKEDTQIESKPQMSNPTTDNLPSEFQEKLKKLEESLRESLKEVKDKISLEDIEVKFLGRKSELTNLLRSLKNFNGEVRAAIGKRANEVRQLIETEISKKSNELKDSSDEYVLDVTAPGKKVETGHLHLTTQAIKEITDIFKRIGFYRVRYPMLDWDYYAFGALNFPPEDPARDDWETFFIDNEDIDPKYGKRLLSPHTSSGQVREMENRKPPIRMINIAKVPRRQLGVRHVMIHYQFEGLVVDKGITIKNLKGVLDYFVKEFFGPERQVRIRPYDFRFTEPSFEVDITCGNCGGKGCKLCKEGWLEIGGAGMVHPKVLIAGGIDPKEYSGFAFGWGVERNKTMQEGIKIDDLRILYQNDLRFLKQF